MQESDWGETTKPKRRIPAWAWWTCGGGCLLSLFAAVFIGLFLWTRVSTAIDPDNVWAGVGELLPFDERPEGWETMLGGSFFGAGQYHLLPPKPTGCQFQLQTFPSNAMLEPFFDPDAPQNRGAFGLGGLEDAKLGTFVLQGREVRSLSFRGLIPGEVSGVGLRLDLSGASGPHAFVQILVPGAGEMLSPETVEELFLPFDVWRGR